MTDTHIASLLPITTHQVGTETQQTVNARDLHAFFQVKTQFNNWMRRYIQKYGFVQDTDFTITIYRNGFGSCAVKEYSLTQACAEMIQTRERMKFKNSPAHNQYIYAIQHGDTEYIKLGQASNYRARIISLQSGNPITLSFLGVWHVADNYKVEKSLHIKLLSFNVSGEWFALNSHALAELFTYMSRYERII